MAAEEAFQFFEQAEIRVEVLARRKWQELDEEVQIALLRIEILARRRPEQFQPPHTVLAAEVDQVIEVIVYGGR